MRKKSRYTLPSLNTKRQKIMVSNIFFSGAVELMFQKDVRTAYCIQRIYGNDPDGNRRVFIEETESGLVYIFFSESFRARVSGAFFTTQNRAFGYYPSFQRRPLPITSDKL